ncbi:unnamed protein product [Bursaphelenchus okinawaensis]|uniref:N-acetyllactosaminide beta-1,3-N-acetylglucosaminyltransferase n=1 Tax=Bursaphelenchus okinawaensis TaxID=465554 RepID=A0A811L5K0_9BILA|nr:unnamed protein product [Bursaphelenchus okinawaensis]CAG9119884.1 unnamed protein product [Bursaphelenchus okinawaensis]
MGAFKKLICVISGVLMLTTISFNTLSLNNTNISTVTLPQVQKAISLDFVQYSNIDYCVGYNYWSSSDEYDGKITFVVHSTYDYLQYIAEHIPTWTGSISLALYVDYVNDETFVKNLNAVISKLEGLEEVKSSRKVGVHLFYKKKKSYDECQSFTISGENDVYESNIDDIYPINVARNIARRGTKSNLFISGDIENFFVPNYEEWMRKLAETTLFGKEQKLVLVHRRFEVAEGMIIPKTKKQLYKLYQEKLAVVFHHYFYKIGHTIPRIEDWFKHPEDMESTSVQQVMNYPNSRWEPQFVGRSDQVPYHDETFPFRMSSNTHLCSEMCRAGFKFAVVYDLFTVHVGIKRKESANEKSVRLKVWHNGYRKVTQNFIRRLDEQYPDTKDKCPKFVM